MIKHTLVIGLQLGDEAKSKVVDTLANQHDVVVRHHGGSNCGHTVKVNGVTTVFHLIPVGVLSNKLSFIGNGVAFDATSFATEVKMIKDLRLDDSLVKVSENAHVVLPYHIELDKYRETQLKIGSTLRGISPCYEDKAARRGIQVKDLFDFEVLHQKITLRNLQTTGVTGKEIELANSIFESCSWIKPYVVAYNYLQNKGSCIYEGAQSALLDLDFGYYPYVTSSNAVSNYAGVGSGLSLLNKQVDVIGVFKPYITSVSNGPFPTSIEHTEPALAQTIRQKGAEYGATTGRPRHIGWLDLDSLRDVIALNGVTSLALMKSDVLCGLPSVKVMKNGVLTSMEGWNTLEDTTFRMFWEEIERFTGTKISIISTGPGREETIFL